MEQLDQNDHSNNLLSYIYSEQEFIETHEVINFNNSFTINYI